jgi:hypothetical protein
VEHARTRFAAVVVVTLAALSAPAVSRPGGAARAVEPLLLRVPARGIQPQVVSDGRGTLHLLYFSGEPANGDVFYVRWEGRPGNFSAPIRVNSRPRSVIATGTVRGAHLALGREGRIHVAWMGSAEAERTRGGATPMMYARLNDDGTAFESERNLLQFAAGLDGGGTVAADDHGRVYVAWHAGGPEGKDESNRRVWVAVSQDDGRTFARERAASAASTGACGCCGMRALATRSGGLFVLYRAATALVHRGSYLLESQDHGATFGSTKLQDWDVNACQMSTYSLSADGDNVLGAWETAGQVQWARVAGSSAGRMSIATPSGAATGRKHPSVVSNGRGEVLLVWTEGTGWNKGGDLAWQMFDASGRRISGVETRPGVAVWSLGAAAVLPDGRFVVLY